MLSLFGLKSKERPTTAEFAHLVVDERGTVMFANQAFVDLVQLKTRKRVAAKDAMGKTINEVFGCETGNTFVGTFLKQKSPATGEFLIGNRLFQVVVEEIEVGNETLYESFYFPIRFRDDNANHRLLQNIAWEIASGKGYNDVDWIRDISDNHCKQLISCLITHEHATIPERYCPFRLRCGFDPVHGWLQLDRRAFYRTKVNFGGEAYLKALKNRPVPSHVSRKKMVCRALDLSMEGIRIQLPYCLPDQSRLHLVFEEFEAEGTVVWTKEDQEQWLAGIKFLDLEEEQQSQVIRAMNKRRILVRPCR